MILEYLVQQLNLILMISFIFFYSLLVLIRNSKTGLADFGRNLVYMGSGLLFTFYIFQISYIQSYKELEYLFAFLVALSFRDLLPVLINFTTDLVTVKLNQIDAKLKKENTK